MRYFTAMRYLINGGCETEGVGSSPSNTSRIVSGTLEGWWKFYQDSPGSLIGMPPAVR
jgi:hypothetical protein